MVWVNLLPWRLRQRQQLLRRSFAASCGALALLLLITAPIYMLACDDNQRGQQRLDELKMAVSRVEQQLHLQQQALATQAQLGQQWQRLQAQRQDAKAWLTFFEQLGEIMPATLWLTRLEQDADSLLMEGQSYAIEEIKLFRQRLSQQPLLQKVQQGNISRHENGELHFRLTASIRRAQSDG